MPPSISPLSRYESGVQDVKHKLPTESKNDQGCLEFEPGLMKHRLCIMRHLAHIHSLIRLPLPAQSNEHLHAPVRNAGGAGRC